jgi:hypothetical protein
MADCKFETVGLMIDVSRNAVMSIEGWRRFLPLISEMGYNAIFLYMEDVYEVIDEPFFGYMRGRYTLSELSELGKDNALYRELAKIVEEHNGLWSPEAEKYLLANAEPLV